MSIINYPFYCIDRMDTAKASEFMRNHLHVVYGWTIDRQKHGSHLSPAFFESKMHVFSVIVNKGFKIC